MVVGQRDVHHRPDDHLALAGDRALFDLVQAENAHLGRVEDRRAQQRAEHAAVGDGKGAPAQIV